MSSLFSGQVMVVNRHHIGCGPSSFFANSDNQFKWAPKVMTGLLQICPYKNIEPFAVTNNV